MSFPETLHPYYKGDARKMTLYVTVQAIASGNEYPASSTIRTPRGKRATHIHTQAPEPFHEIFTTLSYQGKFVTNA